MSNEFPKYENICKKLNLKNEDELQNFIVKHNKYLPQIGYGINEEYGSDHYGFKIVDVSNDFSIIKFCGICADSIHYAVICTDKRKKCYGKYVIAALDKTYTKLHRIGKTEMWISKEFIPTKLDPSF